MDSCPAVADLETFHTATLAVAKWQLFCLSLGTVSQSCSDHTHTLHSCLFDSTRHSYSERNETGLQCFHKENFYRWSKDAANKVFL